MEYTREKIRELLGDMAEPDYAKFTGSLLGREAVMLGVRLPKLRELAKKIAKTDGREYLENTLHMTIVNSKRIMTVEKMTQIDEKYLMMNAEDYNCMAVVSSHTYNSDGVMFEYTQSRHRPDYFRFYDNAVRKPI